MKILRLLGLAALAAAPLAAGQIDYGTGSQAMPWLKQDNNAATAGMAGVAVANEVNVNAIGANPASLAGLKGQQAGFMHDAGLEGVSTEHAAYGLGLGQGVGAALSVAYLNFGSVSTYQVAGNGLVQGADINPSGLAIALGVGKSIGPLSGGVALKWAREDLGSSQSSAVAGDLGLRYSTDAGISLGVAAQNLGGSVNGSALPTAYRLGAAYAREVAKNQSVEAGVEAQTPSSEFKAATVRLGAQYGLEDNLALRGGYIIAAGDAVDSAFTVGAGVGYKGVHLDYAFEPSKDLGNRNRFSILANF
jgi:hypothetical protein